MASDQSELRLTPNGPIIVIPTVPRWASREALGVWVIDGLAYKIYGNENGYTKALKNLLDAEKHALPVPAWSAIPNASIKLNTGPNARWRECWIIRSKIVEGLHWTMQHGEGQFRAAIDQVATPEMIKRCERACNAAIQCGLQDPQGFVIPDGPSPLIFIDVHCTNKPTQVTEDMLVIVVERARQIGQGVAE